MAVAARAKAVRLESRRVALPNSNQTFWSVSLAPDSMRKRWQPMESTSVPLGVPPHLSEPSGTPSASASREQPLASTTVQPRLSYRHPASGAWLPAWPPTQVDTLTVSRTPLLPDAVRIDFGAADAPWPPMVLPVSANYISDPSAVRSTFGGGSD